MGREGGEGRRLTVKRMERWGTKRERVFHMLRFARGSIPEEGSSRRRTSGLPARRQLGTS